MSIPGYLIPFAEQILVYLREAPDAWTTTYMIRKRLQTGDTAGVRRLLKRLEDAGSIEADRSCGNNTRWRVKKL